MEETLVYILRFEHREAVERAFGLLYDEAAVSSCTIEPEELGIRFLADRKGGAPLLERVQDSGGLVWCKSYALQSTHEGRGAP